MVSGVQRQSAKIYEFPTGALRAQRSFERNDTLSATRYSDLASGNCWYHDEAVREVQDTTVKPAN